MGRAEHRRRMNAGSSTLYGEADNSKFFFGAYLEEEVVNPTEDSRRVE